jgi:hypothetical protein
MIFRREPRKRSTAKVRLDIGFVRRPGIDSFGRK